MKWFNSLVILSGVIMAVHSFAFNNTEKNVPKPVTSQKKYIIIAIDNDLLTQREKNRLKILWNTEVSLEAKMKYLAIAMRNFNKKTEEVLQYIEDTYITQPKLCYELKELLISLNYNSLETNPYMLGLIKDLKNDGYHLHILVNNGPKTFKILESQSTLHQIFHEFDLSYTQYIDFSQKPIITKDNPAYFQNYLSKLKANALINDNSQVLYIDNNSAHLAAAQSCGIRIMLFNDAPTLREDLRKINIL